MRTVTPPCSDKTSIFNRLWTQLSEKSAQIGPEWLGLTAIIAWPLIIILFATLGDLRCRPGDRNTINGRDLCPTEKAP